MVLPFEKSIGAQGARSGLPGLILFALVLAALSALAAMTYAERMNRASRERIRADISAVADDKVRRITGWRRHRLQDVELLTGSPTLTSQVHEYVHPGQSPEVRRRIDSWVQLLVAAGDFSRLSILDPGGREVVTIPAPAPGAATTLCPLIAKALASHEITFSDLHRHPGPHEAGIRIDVVAPVFADGEPPSEPCAYLVLEIDPELFLYPLLRSWPTASTSGEVALFRRDGDDVLCLNEMRHRKGTALNFRVPIKDSNIPAARALRGEVGPFEATDYRGIPVVAVARQVPGTDWRVLAKQDRGEVYAPLDREARLAGLCAGLLALLALAGLGLAFYRQRAALLEQGRRGEAERAALVERLAILNAAVEQCASTVLITNERAEIQYVNSRFQETSGYTREEALGRNPRIVESGEYDEAFYQAILDQIRAGNVWRGELHNRRKDGALYWESVTITPVKGASGGITNFITVKEEITRRKETEAGLLRYKEQLEEQNRQLLVLKLAIHECGSSILITDAQGGIQYVNPTFERTTGYTLEEVLGKTPRLLKSGRHPPGFYKELWDTVTSGRVWMGELHNRRRNGTLYWERTVIAPVRDAAGVITNFIATKEDITERNAAQAALREHAEELEAQNEELDAFAHTVAHDLKNPLTVIVGVAGLLASQFQGPGNSDQLKAVELVGRTGLKMNAIIEELMLLAGVRKQAVPVGALDVSLSLWASTERLAPLVSERKARITLAGDPQWPEAIAYGPWLEEVWANLLSNAIKYGGTPPVVEVGAGQAGDGVIRFWVADNGRGVPAERVPELFLPFTKLTQARASGHGLGLSIVRRIIDRLGGGVGYEPRPGGGGLFYFTLPAAPVTGA